MGKTSTRRVIVPRWRPLSYPLPELARRRPRSYEEWSALRRWGKLPREEETIAGFLLREARESGGLTQTELAKRLSRSQQAISQAERWDSNPTVSLLVEWAEAVGRRLRLEMPKPAGSSASIEIDAETDLALRDAAAREGMTPFVLAAVVLRQYARGVGRPAPRGIGAYRSGRSDVSSRVEDLPRSAAGKKGR